VSTWALVPARSFATAKSRMAHLGAGRPALARALLDHVLSVLGRAGLDGVLVATDGEDVAAMAREHGAEVLFDATSMVAGVPVPLAVVVDRGLAALEGRGADAALVLMADLPLLAPADVRRMIGALPGADVVAAPDRDHLGTNALALRLPAALPTCFGNADSYQRHLVAAAARAMRVVTIDRDTLGFDLDGPVDLADLLATHATEPEARIGGEGAVGAEAVVGVLDAIERIVHAAGRLTGLGLHHAQHAVQRRTLRRHPPRAARNAS